jgi:hypothetical protein
MIRVLISRFEGLAQLSVLGLLVLVLFGVTPSAAQFVCGAAGTYPVAGGNVTVDKGGADATGSNTAVCGTNAGTNAGAGSNSNTAFGASRVRP